MTNGLDPGAETAFLGWMLDSVVADARGDHLQTLPVAPKGRFWLGRLAPEVVVQNSSLGERSERLEPCEIGPGTTDPGRQSGAGVLGATRRLG